MDIPLNAQFIGKIYLPNISHYLGVITSFKGLWFKDRTSMSQLVQNLTSSCLDKTTKIDLWNDFQDYVDAILSKPE